MFIDEIMFYLCFSGRKQVVSERELNEMVAHSLKDIPSDAEISDIDDAEVEVIPQYIQSDQMVLYQDFLIRVN